jgi:hypothetical protein
MKKIYLFIFLLWGIVVFPQTLVGTVNLPSGTYWNQAWGMTYENSKLWITSGSSTSGAGIFYAVDSTGSVVDTIDIDYPVMSYSQGIAFDGTYFWYLERRSSTFGLFKVDMNGNVLDSIKIFSGKLLGGAAWDGSGIWVSYYFPNNEAALYKVDVNTKTIIDTIPTLGIQPHGIEIIGDTLFYVMDGLDGDDERIYAVDLTTKDTLFSWYVPEQQGLRQNPRDVAWDGEYFWLLAEPIGASSGRQLFKYNLSGSGSPGITVLTPNINFGNVQIDSTSTSTIYIQNFGNANLILDSVIISNTVFTLDETFPVIIAPGAIKSIPVSFTPTANVNYVDSIRFYHNDPNHIYSKVNVTGRGVYTAPFIGLTPSSINFGNKRVNSTSYREITVTNLGSEELNIDSVTNNTQYFYFEHLTTPLILDSVSSLTFRVWFNPDQITSYQDTIRFYSNASNGNVTALPLSGNGVSFDPALGNIVWQGHVPDNPSTTFNQYLPRSMKKISDISGDGIEDIIIATENYWTIAYNGNSSGTDDILWKFSSYINSSNAGSVDWVQGLQIASDLNGDGSPDVVIGTAGGNEYVYALDGKTGNVIWEYGDPINYNNGDIMGLDVKRDWNNDGVPDVLASASGNESTGQGRFSVYLFNGVNGNIIWQINQASQQKLKYMVTSTDFGGAVGSRVGTTNEVIGFNQSGQIIWIFPTAGTPWTVVEMPNVGGSPSSDVLVGTTTGNVYVLSGDNGSVIWQTNIGSVFIEDARVVSDVNESGTRDILISGIAPNVYVLEGSNGQVIWSNNTGGNILGIAQLGDMNGDAVPELGTASLNNLIHVYDARTGNTVFSYSFGGGGTSTAAEHLEPIDDIDFNGNLEFVAGSRDGRIIAFSGGTEGIPVELSSFNATVTGSDVNLMWTTASEMNNRGFEIERKNISENENPWEKIAFVKGKGTTTEINIYSYIDVNVDAGKYKYRLKQVDFDGSFIYSGEVEVIVGLPDNYTLEQNYPNPFNPVTVIRFSIPVESNVKLSVYNLLGEEVASLVNENLKAGYHEVEWRGTDKNNYLLPSGVYFYRLESNDPSRRSGQSFVDIKKMLFLK